MTSFAALHRPGDPLVLPNAWDMVTGAALAAAGFPAIGTTSLGVAAAAGATPQATLASTLGFLAGNGAQNAAIGGAQVPGSLQGTLSRATMTKMKMRDYGGAEKDLSEAIEVDPKNWIAYRLRAFVRRYMKKGTEAEQDADKALELLRARASSS